MARELGLYGYFGKGNLGDEALRQIWQASLAPEYTVRPLAPPRLPVLRGPWLFSGGLLQDRTSFRSLAFYSGAIAIAARRGPVGLASVSVELKRRAARRLVRQVLSRAGYLSVRDPVSERRLAELGMRAKLYPDPVLAWEAPASQPHKDYILVNAVPSLSAGLSRRVIGKARKLGQAWGMKTWGLALAPEDKLALGGLTLLQPRSPGELLALLSRAALLIAARLHALEFSLVAGVPFVALPYADKVTGFLELVGEELPQPVPLGSEDWSRVSAEKWRAGLERARARLATWAKEGMADVKRWLAGVA